MPDFHEYKAKADELRRKLAQLDQLTGRADERQRDADRKRATRAQRRIVEIPRCEDPKRRKRLEKDIFKWLPWYHPEPYGEHPFTDQVREIIQAILAAFRDGEDQGIAASRGEGKTTAGEAVTMFCALKGEVPFAILFEATGADAQDSLAAIKERLETNPRLAADYPEVCVPIQALNHTAQLARTQLVSGYRHDNGERFEAVPAHFKWCGKEIILPHVPGSPAAGSIIATRGLDAAVRGVKRGGKALRPSAAIINDPDTTNTVNNPDEQGKKLELKIDRSIAYLGGQKKRVARVVLTTIQRRGTVSDKFTNPKLKPSFKGKVFRFLVKKPDREELWAEYVQLKTEDWFNAAQESRTRRADAFYDQHFEAMNAGAIVANPYRRGEAGERSALQFYFNEVARIGPEGAATELDNDPPEETAAVESGITPHRIQRQLSGFDRGVFPSLPTLLVKGFDVNKAALHWVVRAYSPDGIFTIDYDVHEVVGTKAGVDEGVELAIRRAILWSIEETRRTEYMTPGGEIVPVQLMLIDARYMTDAVCAACAEAGAGVMAVMGFGRSTGCVEANFSEVQRTTKDRKPGDGWFLKRKGSIWVVCADTDRWKRWEHDRWMTGRGKPGCLYLFGEPGEPGSRLNDDERKHHAYARHLCNEVEIDELHKGVMRRRFKVKGKNQHYLDASYYCDVGANMLGYRLASSVAKPTANVPGVTPPAADLPAPGQWFSSQAKRKK